jgi:hypothetical protein
MATDQEKISAVLDMVEDYRKAAHYRTAKHFLPQIKEALKDRDVDPNVVLALVKRYREVFDSETARRILLQIKHALNPEPLVELEVTTDEPTEPEENGERFEIEIGPDEDEETETDQSSDDL